MSTLDDEVPVSGTDELAVEPGEQPEEIRRFGDYKPTNVPLSAVELHEREALCTKRNAECDWQPRTPETIHDMAPIEEHEPIP